MAKLLNLIQVLVSEISSKVAASIDLSQFLRRHDFMQAGSFSQPSSLLQPHADCCPGRRGRIQEVKCNCKCLGKSAKEMGLSHFQMMSDGDLISPAANSLPDCVILADILPRLPISSLFRFRAVCKQWKKYLESYCFAERFTELHGLEGPRMVQPFFAADGEDCKESQVVAAALYHPDEGNWISMEIPWPDPPQYIDGREAVDSSEGLMCYIRNRGHIGTPLGLIVVNPLTNCWRVLPPMLHPGFKICYNSTLVKIVPNSQASGFGYKIIVTTREKGENLSSTEVYDSLSNSWKTTSYIPFPGRISCRGKGPCINGHFFCIFSDQTGSFFMLMDYDVKQESWKRVRMGRSQSMCGIPSLLECQGRLLMVGGYGRNHSRTQYFWQRRYSASRDVPLVRISRQARSTGGGGYLSNRHIPLERIRVWDVKLAGDTSAAEMVAEIPKDIFGKLVYGTNGEECLLGDAQYILEDMDIRMPRCFAVGRRIFFANFRTRITAAYHIENKFWTWVTECPKELFPHARHFYGAPTCFTPNLRAIP